MKAEDAKRMTKHEFREWIGAQRPLLNVRLKDLQCDGLSDKEIARVIAQMEERAMSDTHKQWNSGSKEWGVTFCGRGTWNLELSDEPTCEKCQQEMNRERFRARHCEMLKLDTDDGFYIIERRKHNMGFINGTLAMFAEKEDRDNIYEAMRLGGYCGHSKKSWIRSILPPGVKRWGLLR